MVKRLTKISYQLSYQEEQVKYFLETELSLSCYINKPKRGNLLGDCKS